MAKNRNLSALINSVSVNNSNGVITLSGSVNIGAGNGSLAPLDFTPSGSTLLQIGNVVGGEMEVDSKNTLYYHTGTDNRGVVPSEQFLVSNATRTLTSTQNGQPLFGVIAGNSLQANQSSSYFFECFFTLSSMSTTLGNCGFQLSGSFTTSSAAFWVQGLDNSTLTTATTLGGRYVDGGATTTNIVSASAGTSMAAMIRGTFRTLRSGSVLPSINLQTAASAVVGANSYFRMYLIGSNTVTNTIIDIS